MKHIFVSYARKDSEEANRIVATLDAIGFPFWIDTADIRFGVWTKAIEDAICNAGVVIVLLSDNSIRSEAVMREIELAKKEGKPIIPLEIRATELPNRLYDLTGEYQRIPIHQIPFEKWFSILQDALGAYGFQPQLIDLEDKRFLKARAFADAGNFLEAIRMAEELLEKRPFHLAAVSDLITYYYEAGHARLLDEEEQGLRPPNQPELVEEFKRAEVIAARYIQEDYGLVNGFFRSQIWTTLGMLSSFVGKYDDAFKRLETARVCDENNERPVKLLEKLRNALQLRYTRDAHGRERPIEEVYPHMRGRVPRIIFPEPNKYATWHAITFPFTVMLKGLSFVFPDGISDDWQSLWVIDHNIGQLERLDAGENTERILLRSIEAMPNFTSLELARLAWKRIFGAVSNLAIFPDQKERIDKAAKSTLDSLHHNVPADELKAIWNPEDQ